MTIFPTKFHTGNNEGVTNGSINMVHAAVLVSLGAIGGLAGGGQLGYKNGLKDGVKISAAANDAGEDIDESLIGRSKEFGVKPRIVGLI